MAGEGGDVREGVGKVAGPVGIRRREAVVFRGSGREAVVFRKRGGAEPVGTRASRAPGDPNKA